MTAAPSPFTLPPARVIALWNTVAEDTGTLDTTLLKFADLLLAEAQAAQTSPHATRSEAISAADVSQHPPEPEAAA